MDAGCTIGFIALQSSRWYELLSRILEIQVIGVSACILFYHKHQF